MVLVSITVLKGFDAKLVCFTSLLVWQ